MKLCLFFTEGVSLKTWDTVGMLDREIALYRELLQKQIEVTFVTYGNSEDLAYQARIPGLKLHVNEANSPFGMYRRSLVKRPPRADVIKSNQIAGADIALEAAKQAKAKFVARCGYLLSEVQEKKYGIRSREAKAARNLEKSVFRGADAAVVTTPRIAGEVAARYSVNRDKITVIPNYVEIDRFKPKQREPNKIPRVVFVGRLDKEKNLIALIEAVSGFEVEVWLIGYGPQREQLERLAQNKVASFKFLGAVPNRELPQLLNQCDIFVLPSLYEGHPKALLEAMACGLPVIGTDVVGIQEVIQNESTGLLSKPDPEGLKRSLERLINDSSLRQKLAQAGRASIAEQFSLERIVDLEFNLLRRLVSET
jgi:glycosyltransferase involved in cell wall biosynthesis